MNDSEGGFVGGWHDRWRGRPFDGTNDDISPGSYRPLALQQPPFDLNAGLLTQYWNRTRELKVAQGSPGLDQSGTILN